MFDEHARSLFDDFTEFEGLTRDDSTRALSEAYLSIIRLRVNGINDSPEDLSQVQPHLRRIANTLMFHVILRESQSASDRRAASFVAAEAIALMADFIRAIENLEASDRLSASVRSPERLARIESALLYLYAQYDACAGGVLSAAEYHNPEPGDLVNAVADYCFTKLERLCRLELNRVSDAQTPILVPWKEHFSALELEEDTVARLYLELATIIDQFAAWLGNAEVEVAGTIARLDRMIAILGDVSDADIPPIGNEFARIHHVCTLLRLCLPALRDRALVHVVPAPSSGDSNGYRSYLRDRAVGAQDEASRPVLWPSVLEYVRSSIVGDARNVIVSMPTGSGKSFIAELAVSQAVCDGWALYLAPTNALTEQIRGDLRVGLKALETDVRAFIGDYEYSVLASDRVDDMPTNSVAVMTPEKCALALRLSPGTFANCRLVVFDECHLIGETGSSRGPVAELVLTQLMLRAPGSRFLLMSAILQNPEQLAEWVGTATGANSAPLTIKWRPTRTLRTVLGVEHHSFREAAVAAREQLKSMPQHRRKMPFDARYAVAASLHGAWRSQNEPDYAVVPLDCQAALAVRRTLSNGAWTYSFRPDSWVNLTAIRVAQKLASSGIQTLVFTPASKHYPFANGAKVDLSQSVREHLPTAPDLVETCKTLAEYELGCASEVFELLARGVAVHTSIMLETEKISSEAAFRARSAPLMFATGTLAQGLNLPAIAVVIAGTRIGDPRGQDSRIVQRRRFSQLLNAAGRAGRAGFSNQGIVVAVPDKPISFRTFDDILNARDQADYLQQSDDSVAVESGLQGFLDAICERTLRPDRANDLELQVISLLGGGDATQLDPHAVLHRSYASYLRRKAGVREVTSQDAEQVVGMGRQFIADTGAPTWLTVAAQRAGLDFFLTLAIIRAWTRVRPEPQQGYADLSVAAWTRELVRVVVHIPPALLSQHLPKSRLKHVSRAFASLDDRLYDQRNFEWQPPQQWVAAWNTIIPPLLAWMQGGTVAEIASLVCECPIDEITSDRRQGKPLPKALTVTGESWSSLALIAGGFLAVAEQVLNEAVPLALACLPMCIKYGCDSPETLAWFRFGVRLRRPSRLLARRFPAPDLATDDALRSWVRSARSDWLRSHVTEDDHDPNRDVMGAIRSFITQ